MIISASRRTDIPAFYSDWFFNRIKEGFVLVRNPRNWHFVSRVSLSPDMVDFIVFWTKDPFNMLGKLDLLEGSKIPYYFLFTITGYEQDFERNLRPKDEIIETFIQLSERIGKERVIWRYDPVFLTSKIDLTYHRTHFEYIIKRLHRCTAKCIMSFLVLYRKCVRKLSTIGLMDTDKLKVAASLQSVAQKYDLKIETCAVDIDLSDIGIEHGKCIDNELISHIINKKVVLKKDPSQRPSCRCVESVDIGSYDTCLHDCIYCYANDNIKIAQKNHSMHDAESSLLYGEINRNDMIVDRQIRSCIGM